MGEQDTGEHGEEGGGAHGDADYGCPLQRHVCGGGGAYPFLVGLKAFFTKKYFGIRLGLIILFCFGFFGEGWV